MHVECVHAYNSIGTTSHHLWFVLIKAEYIYLYSLYQHWCSVCARAHIHAYTRTYTRTHTHIHTHAHSRTHTHTHNVSPTSFYQVAQAELKFGTEHTSHKRAIVEALEEGRIKNELLLSDETYQRERMRERMQALGAWSLQSFHRAWGIVYHSQGPFIAYLINTIRLCEGNGSVHIHLSLQSFHRTPLSAPVLRDQWL